MSGRKSTLTYCSEKNEKHLEKEFMIWKRKEEYFGKAYRN